MIFLIFCPVFFVVQHPFNLNMLVRVASLQLIRTALESFPNEFAVEPQVELLHEYIKLFFTSLTVKPVIVVEAAHAALSQVRRLSRRRLRCGLLLLAALDSSGYVLDCGAGHPFPAHIGELVAQGAVAGLPSTDAVLVSGPVHRGLQGPLQTAVAGVELRCDDTQ